MKRSTTDMPKGYLEAVVREAARDQIVSELLKGKQPSQALLAEFEPQAPRDWSAGLVKRLEKARAERATGPLHGRWLLAYLIELDLLEHQLRQKVLSMAGISPEAFIGPGAYPTPMGAALVAAFDNELRQAAETLQAQFLRQQVQQASRTPHRALRRGERI